MRKYLLTLALLGAATPVMAQGKPAAPAAAKPKMEIVNQGELRLDGKITALLGEGVWQMEALSWTSPRGVTTEFDEPKNKGVSVSAQAYLHPRGEEVKVPLKDVKLGSRVAVIGKNGPDGSLIAREVILLEGYGSRRTVGQVQSNPATSLLVRQSREARDAGQLPKAMTLITRAVDTARAINDGGGEGLAMQDKALLHMDLDQPEQAMASFKRVETVGRNMGNALLTSLGIGGVSGLMMRQGRLQDAIELLKDGDSISARAEPTVHLGILGRLSSAYLANGQLAEGVATLQRIHPLEQAQGKESDAGETLLLIAALQADDKSEEARQALAAAQERIDRARDEKGKANLIGAAALVRWRLDEKEQATAGFTQAAQLLSAAGDAKSARKWEQMDKELEGAEGDWKAFWMAASGLKSQQAKPKPEADAPPADAPPADENAR